jgi:DNA-nicking Smr family endonuclease
MKNKTSVAAFADLAAIKKTLAEQERLATQALAEQQAQEAARLAHKNLFANAAGKVSKLADKHVSQHAAMLKKPPPAPVPRQQQRDEQAVLVESLSDEFDVTTLLEVDDQMSFLRPGIGADVLKKLRRGNWSIQAQLDLHGLRQDEAREKLGEFLRNCGKQGLRCLRIVHGKGLGSPGKAPVLKSRVQRWLVQKNEVLAFVQAKPADGGAGALVVLLQAG